MAASASRCVGLLLKRRSGFVATEYGMAMAVMAMGLIGGEPGVGGFERLTGAPEAPAQQQVQSEREAAPAVAAKLDGADLYGAAVVARLVTGEPRVYH